MSAPLAWIPCLRIYAKATGIPYGVSLTKSVPVDALAALAAAPTCPDMIALLDKLRGDFQPLSISCVTFSAINAGNIIDLRSDELDPLCAFYDRFALDFSLDSDAIGEGVVVLSHWVHRGGQVVCTLWTPSVILLWFIPIGWRASMSMMPVPLRTALRTVPPCNKQGSANQNPRARAGRAFIRVSQVVAKGVTIAQTTGPIAFRLSALGPMPKKFATGMKMETNARGATGMKMETNANGATGKALQLALQLPGP
eukprot:g9860.t1